MGDLLNKIKDRKKNNSTIYIPGGTHSINSDNVLNESSSQNQCIKCDEEKGFNSDYCYEHQCAKCFKGRNDDSKYCTEHSENNSTSQIPIPMMMPMFIPTPIVMPTPMSMPVLYQHRVIVLQKLHYMGIFNL
jgi:hypothetical protein